MRKTKSSPIFFQFRLSGVKEENIYSYFSFIADTVNLDIHTTLFELTRDIRDFKPKQVVLVNKIKRVIGM